MLKDYFVLDNFFDNARELILLAKQAKYFSNETNSLPGVNLYEDNQNKPGGKWRGFRTSSLNVSYPDLHTQLMQKVIQETFVNFDPVSNESFSYFHLSCRHIPYDDTWWHVDNSDKKSIYAGVVYLTPDVNDIPGTLLKINDNNIVIKYKFNRLLFYKSNILHRPGCTFGETIDNARLTFTFFINSLNLTTRKNHA